MTYTLTIILALVGVAASAIMVIGLWDAVHTATTKAASASARQAIPDAL